MARGRRKRGPLGGPNQFKVSFRSGQGWVVTGPDGRVVFGPNKLQAYAEAAADKARREADRAQGRGTRACLCCGTSFTSEGKHNRLCPHCRNKDSGPVPARFAGMNKRARVQYA